MTALTPEGFASAVDVSRETLGRLSLYADLLRKWTRAINLVGPDTLPDLWRRHFLDSAQLYPLLPKGCRRLADLGSGAGFPGLVLAILGVPDVHLVESDGRKVQFLRTVSRETGVPVTVHSGRIEELSPLCADCVTARALAPLDRLLDYAVPHLAPDGVALFLKGQGAEEELVPAARRWTMTVERRPSVTDPRGRILRLAGLAIRTEDPA